MLNLRHACIGSVTSSKPLVVQGMTRPMLTHYSSHLRKCRRNSSFLEIGFEKSWNRSRLGELTRTAQADQEWKGRHSAECRPVVAAQVTCRFDTTKPPQQVRDDI